MRVNRFMAGLAVVFMFLATAMPGYAYPGIKQNSTFLFSDDMLLPVTIPDTYKLYKVMPITDGQQSIVSEPQDIYVTEAGRIFVLDKSGGRIIIYRANLTWEKIIDTFTLETGETTSLNKPEGIFVYHDGTIYIADTANQRILRVDEGGQVLDILNRPESFQGTAIQSFNPTKLVVDSAGRVSAVARSINMGLLQFDAEGHFTGYVGAPKVKVNLITKLWKRFSTQEQKAQMQQFVPTEYSNIAIDNSDFIYGTISSLAMTDAVNEMRDPSNGGTHTPIKKLNSMGVDVLKRNGLYSPLGNLDFRKENSVSRIIDVALGPAGSYTLLDGAKNILYTYSEEGVLLHAFGGTGKRKDQFERPAAVSYQGDNLLVLDSLLSQLMVYKPTLYGEAVLAAITAEHEGDFDVAYQLWNDVVKLNSNFRYAYTGLGKIRYEEGKYSEAMAYYKYAFDGKEYAKAKEKYRQDYMAMAFPILFAVIGSTAVGFAAFGFVKKVRTYLRRGL